MGDPSDEVAMSQGNGRARRHGGDEGRLRALVEYATELILELDPREGSFTYVSPSVRDLLGYDPDEFLRLAPLAIVHPDDVEATARVYAEITRSEGRIHSFHRARHKDGTWRHIHDVARSFRTADGHLRIAIFGRDITDLKEVEDELELQLVVQQKVADMSRDFLPLASDELEASLRRHLATAAELAGADRVRLIVAEPAEKVVIGVYDWAAVGIPRRFPDLDDAVRERFRWSTRQLAHGQVLHVPSLEMLPEEADMERVDFRNRGVQSLLCIPVSSGDAIVGYQVFETVREARFWSPREITLLGLVVEIFAGAIRRRHAEAALRESEERFRAIAEHATELVAEFDRAGRYRYASPSFERLLGQTPHALLGRRIADDIHPDDLDATVRIVEHAFRAESEARAMLRIRHRDGSWRWIDYSGRVYRAATGGRRLVAIGRDVTARKSMEEAMQRQLGLEKRIAGLSRRFLALAEGEFEPAIREALRESAELAGADRCFLVSTEFGKDGQMPYYQWCAAGVAPYAGARRPWAEGQVAAGRTLHFASVEELPEDASLERQSLRERGVRSFLTIPVRSGDRTIGIFGFETLHSQSRWSEADVTLLRLIGEILTSALRRERAGAALRESEFKLAQAQKLEAVGRLAGGIAHDFNNLLTVILGFSRPLLQELPPDDPTRDDLVEIHGAAERAAGLTRQLLTFSRRQTVELQTVDLNAVLSSLEGLLGRLLGEDVDLVLDLAPDLPGIVGDPHQFEQVVVNLAANARDAMPDGGTLSIATGRCDLDAHQMARTGLPPGGYVLLRVVDSGEGMDDATRTHIFEPFFTTKEPGKGTGLGLSIAYSVVEQAGGSIRVDGAPRKGTAFEILLPIARGTSHPGVPGDGVVPPRGSECVLVVEDEPSVLRLTRRILEQNGYRVLEAEDGEAALEVAAESETEIEVLLTDVVMPRLGGYELARRLRARLPNLAVVFMSGYPEDGRGGDALPEGALALNKPFTATGLLTRVREVLES
jgi:two-component system cell cycle sensor histidine kinase/response regulator CckA